MQFIIRIGLDLIGLDRVELWTLGLDCIGLDWTAGHLDWT